MLVRHPRDTRALGAAGERLAAEHVRRAGYRVLDRNVSIASGEADLVCLDPDRRTLVIVEVKTRRAHGTTGRPEHDPEVNVDARKRRVLLRVARAIARRRGWKHRPVRIDVVAIVWRDRAEHEVRLIRNAVSSGSS